MTRRSGAEHQCPALAGRARWRHRRPACLVPAGRYRDLTSSGLKGPGIPAMPLARHGVQAVVAPELQAPALVRPGPAAARRRSHVLPQPEQEPGPQAAPRLRALATGMHHGREPSGSGRDASKCCYTGTPVGSSCGWLGEQLPARAGPPAGPSLPRMAACTARRWARPRTDIQRHKRASDGDVELSRCDPASITCLTSGVRQSGRTRFSLQCSVPPRRPGYLRRPAQASAAGRPVRRAGQQ